jgi:Fe-S-cluster containining protein
MAQAPYIDTLLPEAAAEVRAGLARANREEDVHALVDEIFGLATTLTHAIDDKTPADKRRLPVCKPGCDSCCKLHAVLVTPAEALRLAAHLRATRTPKALEALVGEMRAFATRTSEMTKAERAASRLGCPLLDEHGACGVHPARPLLCRAYNSYDLGACLAAYEAGTAETKLDCHTGQVSVGQTLFAALLAGGAEGRQAGPFELVHAVLDALARLDATQRWLDGEAVFGEDAPRIALDASAEWREFLARERA